MSSIATAVYKLTIGWLVDKSRDKAAEKLKDGDVTDQKFRALIVREIDDIKSKLDGLSRKDLGSSISSFKEGIMLLYEVFNKARIRNEYCAATTQAVCAEAFTLAEDMTVLDFTDLDESARKKLSSAKERFKHAREKASEAFNNEALKISDRTLAMQYRVMATILETVDNPEGALTPCRVCIEELNSLSAIQSSFDVQFKKGIQAVVRSLVGKNERRKIISSVCHVNRVVYDVTQTVRKDLPFWIWPALNIGEVDPLRDGRVAQVLREQDMEHCYVPWSFGQAGEEEHKLKNPRGIATNSSGQFIVGDINEVKMFDPTGQFILHFSPHNDDVKTKLDVWDVATDNKDNIYVLVECKKKTGSGELFVYEIFSNTTVLRQKFPVRGEYWVRGLTVTNSQVPVLKGSSVSVYDTDGQSVHSFGEGTLKDPCDITAAKNNCVMVVGRDDSRVHIFSEDGVHLNQFKLRGSYRYPRIAFHLLSEHVVIAGKKEEPVVVVEIFTNNGDFVRSTQIHEERIDCISGMTVTPGGQIALLLQDIKNKWKVLVI